MKQPTCNRSTDTKIILKSRETDVLAVTVGLGSQGSEEGSKIFQFLLCEGPASSSEARICRGLDVAHCVLRMFAWLYDLNLIDDGGAIDSDRPTKDLS